MLTDLNSLLPASSPLLITNAADINSRGEIAVQAFDQTVQDFVAAVLTPSGTDNGPSEALRKRELHNATSFSLKTFGRCCSYYGVFGGFRLRP